MRRDRTPRLAEADQPAALLVDDAWAATTDLVIASPGFSPRHPVIAWVCGGFFGLCGGVALVALLPGAADHVDGCFLLADVDAPAPIRFQWPRSPRDTARFRDTYLRRGAPSDTPAF